MPYHPNPHRARREDAPEGPPAFDMPPQPSGHIVGGLVTDADPRGPRFVADDEGAPVTAGPGAVELTAKWIYERSNFDVLIWEVLREETRDRFREDAREFLTALAGVAADAHCPRCTLVAAAIADADREGLGDARTLQLVHEALGQPRGTGPAAGLPGHAACGHTWLPSAPDDEGSAP